MNRIPISSITEIKDDRIYYREESGDISFIELTPCANSYKLAHDYDENAEVRCVGDRFFGDYAYYELYTAEHTQLYTVLRTSKLQSFISKITGLDFHKKQHEQFCSVEMRLNACGWKTFDLS